MAVNNYLLQSAQRKDCLLALLPCQGGTVPSLLDPSQQVYPEFNSNPSGRSWAERNGLITMQNIAIRNNIFTADDPSKNASIKTQLDFQQNNSSKTFIAKAPFLSSIHTNLQARRKERNHGQREKCKASARNRETMITCRENEKVYTSNFNTM